MMSFTHNLIDPDLPHCPLCGELYCTCDESDFMPEAADDWDDDDLEEIDTQWLEDYISHFGKPWWKS